MQFSIPLNDTYDPAECYPVLLSQGNITNSANTYTMSHQWVWQDFANDQIDGWCIASGTTQVFRIHYAVMKKPNGHKLYQAVHYIQPGAGYERTAIITPTDTIRNPNKCWWWKNCAEQIYDWNGSTRVGYVAAGITLKPVGDGTFRWAANRISAAVTTEQFPASGS